MVHCLLCEKKFKTKRGLSMHLAKTHDIHGPHGRFSLKAIQKFFPLLKKRQWAKAENFLEVSVRKVEEDNWVKGYIHALNGMITALKVTYSPPQPYVVKLEEFSSKKLQEIKEMFSELSKTLNNKNTFDSAYFQAWEDFTQYAIHAQN
jgi:hypothetical protein